MMCKNVPFSLTQPISRGLPTGDCLTAAIDRADILTKSVALLLYRAALAVGASVVASISLFGGYDLMEGIEVSEVADGEFGEDGDGLEGATGEAVHLDLEDLGLDDGFGMSGSKDKLEDASEL